MRASSSSSSHSYRTPLTVPCVPTGINTGVSITERRVRKIPALASPSWAITCQSIGCVIDLFRNKKPAEFRQAFLLIDDLRRTRTFDPMVKSHLLYRLSYQTNFVEISTNETLDCRKKFLINQVVR